MVATTSGGTPVPVFLRLLGGYVAASGAAAATLALGLAARAVVREESLAGIVGVILGMFPGAILAFLAILILSLPSFVLCRALLHLARRTDRISFAALGGINAYGLVSLLMGADTLALYLEYPPDPVIAVAGAVGGLACWSAERQLAGQAVSGAN